MPGGVRTGHRTIHTSLLLVRIPQASCGEEALALADMKLNLHLWLMHQSRAVQEVRVADIVSFVHSESLLNWLGQQASKSRYLSPESFGQERLDARVVRVRAKRV